ncbi:MAG: primosomal protein N' [Gammaproteobacteria bacterium]
MTHGPQTETSLKCLGFSATVIEGLETKGLIQRIRKVLWRDSPKTASLLAEPDLALNDEQTHAIQLINLATSFQCFLLDGITGSGKTEVYLHAIAHRLASAQQTLILIPEINLTPQTLERFRHRFNSPVVAYHSQLSDTEKLTVWQQARSGYARVIIGTRSATLLPLANPGLIVVDEEHDNSFKQQDGFRYHARDVAIYRAQQENIPIILGSATPALESLHNALCGKYTLLRLRHRPTGHAAPPLQFIDIRGQRLQEGLTQIVIEAITEQLHAKHQVLIFLNRRGYAPVILCHHCGACLDCPHCNAHFTWHKHKNCLKCHHCLTQQARPETCPQCGSPELKPLGQGTERIESTLQTVFPNTLIRRVDRDTTQTKSAMDRLREDINRGEPLILIGTQMLAKGHHFPHVTLSIILNGDTGLLSVDFRGTEKLAQLIIQVAGRAGRGTRAGKVLIQTLHPDHPVLQQLKQGGYPAFATHALLERQQANMPPFGHVALLRAEALDPQAVYSHLTQIKNRLCQQINLSNPPLSVEVLGPVPAPLSRRAGLSRQQILLQATERKPLHHVLSLLEHTLHHSEIPTQRIRWSLDVDPIDLY